MWSCVSHCAGGCLLDGAIVRSKKTVMQDLCLSHRFTRNLSPVGFILYSLIIGKKVPRPLRSATLRNEKFFPSACCPSFTASLSFLSLFLFFAQKQTRGAATFSVPVSESVSVSHHQRVNQDVSGYCLTCP